MGGLGDVASIGVDVAEARKGLDVVALDADRRLVASLRRARPADVATLAAAAPRAVVCIDSPSGWATAGRSRAAERALRPLGLTAYSTPTDPGDHPFYRWMRAGFAVFEAVAPTHPRHRGGPFAGTAVEVFPDASAALLAGRRRPAEERKATFRRAVLAAHGVDADGLRSGDQVDAAVAALTGSLALGGAATLLGDVDEGTILLPVAALPSEPLVRRAAAK